MGRGVSSGGGQSSLGYLFGSGEAPQSAINNAVAPQNPGQVSSVPSGKSAAVSSPAVINKEIPAGTQRNMTNNYFRVDGQNTGNFITDRPSTKVHAAPGGGSSMVPSFARALCAWGLDNGFSV